jgi:hypothetical protein
MNASSRQESAQASGRPARVESAEISRPLPCTVAAESFPLALGVVPENFPLAAGKVSGRLELDVDAVMTAVSGCGRLGLES